MVFGDVDVDAVLRRLDRLTFDQALRTAAHFLDVIHGLVENLRKALSGEQISLLLRTLPQTSFSLKMTRLQRKAYGRL
jgi:hypothetical protein